MKTIGLIGGMSWESTAQYYTLVNQGTNGTLGKNHSAKCLIHSCDFQEIEDLQYTGKWDELRSRIFDAGRALKAAGADFAVLCTNTMHKVAGGFEAEVGIPLVHIAEAVGEDIVWRGKKRVGLLGTIFTMEQGFYTGVLEKQYGLEVLIPGKEDRETVNRIIYDELVKGIVLESSRKAYLAIMDKLVDRGAEGIVLGCTEIGLLIQSYSCELFDSTPIHARRAVEFSLG